MATSVKNYGLPEGFTLDDQVAPEAQEDYGLPEGFKLDKAPEKPERSIAEKGSRLVSQAALGGIQIASAPYDIAAIASSKLGNALTPIEYRRNLLDDLEYYDEKKSQGIFTKEDQKHYDQTLDLLKNPQKAEQFLPKESINFDVGTLIEEGAKKIGVDLTPENKAEVAARWIGFIKDPKKAAELLRKLQQYRRYNATVLKTVESGILEVSVDGLGWTNIRCYNTWAAGSETYVNGARIIVAIDDSGICFLLPRELPRGAGKTKVVQIIDDSDPGTLDVDYVRFNSSVFNAFQDESNQ